MMKKQYSNDELRRKAASYCSMAEHCISDVEIKLKAWGVSPENSQEIVSHLLEQDFINEQRYARAFVREKFEINKWGKIKILLALKEKGIDKDSINNALAHIDEGEYEELLARLLKSKLQTISYEYEYEKQGKLFRFAQSRGFESNVIEKVLRRV
ncbi:MAG: regulatory protein RecX [Paludibacteraceae bacterium]